MTSPTIRDYIAAHRKVLLGLASLLAVQFLGSDTADWLVVVFGGGAVGLIPNDEAARKRIYRRGS